jgi:Fe2+ or Zn2+ uptake regulation protein
MPCSSIYTSELRAKGYRMTPQRMTILHILHHSGKHLSPTEIYRQAIKDVPGLTEPTVYRKRMTILLREWDVQLLQP